MQQEDAISLLQLKTQQYIKMIDLLNSQLDVSNNEKQELRLQILALNKDNLTLRREKQTIDYQNQLLQQQILNQEQELKAQRELQSKKNNGEQQEELKKISNNNIISFLEQENKKTSQQNSQLLEEINMLRIQVQQLNATNNQHQFNLDQTKQEITFQQVLIEKKDKYIVDYQKQIIDLQEYYQKKIEILEREKYKLREQVININHESDKEHLYDKNQGQEKLKVSKLDLSAINQPKNQDSLKQYNAIYQDPKFSQLNQQYQVSVERDQDEFANNKADSVGKHQIQESLINQGIRRQSNEQSNGLQLITQHSEIDMGSQYKSSDRQKYSGQSYYN